MSAPTVPETASLSSGAGLGYGIAIAASILVLLSTITLASYACVRIKSGHPLRGGDAVSDTSDGGGGSSTMNSSVRDSIVGLPGPMMTVSIFLGRPMKKEVLVLGESKRMPGPNNGPCSICLSEYRPKESVRCMEDCKHCFHAGCIDQWLHMNPTCPLCRSSPAPTPLPTPLSELVPLAFNRR